MPKFVLLNTLYISVRNSSEFRSLNLKVLLKARSTEDIPGARKLFRLDVSRSPKLGSLTRSVRLPSRFKSQQKSRLYGCPVWNWPMLDTCHPPRMSFCFHSGTSHIRL